MDSCSLFDGEYFDIDIGFIWLSMHEGFDEVDEG